MIHDRMPLMVERDAGRAWLDPRAAQGRPLLACWCPPRRARSRPSRSSTQVNNVRNNGPELVEPLAAEVDEP